MRLRAILIWLVSSAGVCATAELDLAKYAPNAQTLLRTLHEKYPGSIVPLFVQNGGSLAVITFRPQADDARSAVYDRTAQVIKLRKGMDGKIDWSAMDDIAHEFWHAHWHQVASRGEGGGDPTTYQLVIAVRDWLRKQELQFISEGQVGSPPARWNALAWEEFTDEYVAGLLNNLLQLHGRLSKDVASGRKSVAQAQEAWAALLSGKATGNHHLLSNLTSYRGSQSDAAVYQVRGSVLAAVPDIARRLAELYGLKF